MTIFPEWMACQQLNSKQYETLIASGISSEAQVDCGGICWARISTPGRTFDFAPSGQLAFILPVWDGPAPLSPLAEEEPQLADLLAFRLDDPTLWWRRIRQPGAILGSDRLEVAHTHGAPALFYMTPLDWLQAGCRGTVLLDYCEARWEASRLSTTHRTLDAA